MASREDKSGGSTQERIGKIGARVLLFRKALVFDMETKANSQKKRDPYPKDEEREPRGESTFFLQVAAPLLFTLNSLEQRFEIAFAKRFCAFALDDFKKHRRTVLNGLGENLQ